MDDAVVGSGHSGDSWTVSVPCDQSEGGPCAFREMDHYGQPGTGYVWCGTHGHVAGTIRYAAENR